MKKTINILLVIILLFIFSNSLQNGVISTNSSDYFVNKLRDYNPFDTLETFELLIRKLAHFIEYFILGIILFFARKYKTLNVNLLNILLFTGIIDELLQFIPINRSPSIYDMVLDTIALILGMYITKIIFKLINNNFYIKVLKY